MKALPLILILFLGCSQALEPQPQESIEVISIDGVDAISSQLTFSATGNPAVTIVVIDAAGTQHICVPHNVTTSEGVTTGIIDFSPVGPAARSITLSAIWPTHRTDIPVKRS